MCCTLITILQENFDYFHTGSSKNEMNGAIPLTRLSYSVPGSPVEDRLNGAEVIGSAESLVGRVSIIIIIKWKNRHKIKFSTSTRYNTLFKYKISKHKLYSLKLLLF